MEIVPLVARVSAVAVIALYASHQPAGLAQGVEPPRVVTMQTYDAVLDRVFPHADAVSPDVVCAWTVRYFPSAQPEHQVNIVERPAGGLQVVSYSLTIRERDLWTHLDAVVSGGSAAMADVDALAKRAPVVRNVLSDVSAFRDLVAAFRSLQISPWLGTGSYADSGSVRVWVDSAPGSIQFSLSASMRYPIRDWAFGVRAAAGFK